MTERSTFDLTELLHASNDIRSVGAGAASREAVAAALVSYLRDRFLDKDTGRSVLPLVRFYVARPCGELDASLQDFARAAGSDVPIGPAVTCLTLLASAGEEPGWNDRHASVRHKAIPLPSAQALQRLPMVAQLVKQIGLDACHVLKPEPSLFKDLSARAYNVFYVADARDSPYVPAQNDFVIPYGIRSVIGCGGVLPDGAFFAIVLFSSTPIPKSAVEGFVAIGLGAKIALLSNASERIFNSETPAPRSLEQSQALQLDWLEARAATLAQLLDVRAELVDHEAARLESELNEHVERAASLEASRGALGLAEARNRAIVEGALDAIMGMDASGRLVDFNPAAEEMFGFVRGEVIGETLADVVIPYSMRDRHRKGLATFLSTGIGPILERRIEVNALRRDGTEFPVELVVTRVPGIDPPLFNGYVRDISAMRAAAAELQAGQERLAHIARTLQTSLLPPVLPKIHGIELAAVFDAAGDGYVVGGDFYDVFELDDGRWALVLGDVCGKGSDAAALTALARYTVRAAATHDDDPERVLRDLNDAIFREHGERFCTAVYATLDPGSGALAVGLGGHPPPLVLRANGEVSVVGVSSTLLGPFEEWRGPIDRDVLEQGDTLFLYSDGLTEARAGRTLFGDERLRAAVAGTAGLSVTAAVQQIEAAAFDFAGTLSDDLAILAVSRAH